MPIKDGLERVGVLPALTINEFDVLHRLVVAAHNVSVQICGHGGRSPEFKALQDKIKTVQWVTVEEAANA